MYGIFTYIWLTFMVNKQVNIPVPMDPMGYNKRNAVDNLIIFSQTLPSLKLTAEKRTLIKWIFVGRQSGFLIGSTGLFSGRVHSLKLT